MSDIKIILDLAEKGELDKAIKELDLFKEGIRGVEASEKQRQQTFQKGFKEQKDELGKVNLEMEKLQKQSTEMTGEQKKQYDQLKKKQNELTKEVQQYQAANEQTKKQIKGQSEEAIGLYEQQRKRLRELKEEMKRAKDEFELSKVNKQVAETEAELKRLSRAGKENADVSENLSNTYDGLVERNKALKNQMRQLPLNDTSGELERLQAEYKANNDRLKEFDASLGNHQRNVGDYAGGIEEAANSLTIMGTDVGSVRDTISAFTAGVQANVAAMRASAAATGGWTKALKLLKAALISTGIGAIVVALGSLVTILAKTQGGIDLASKAFRIMGTTIDVLIGRLTTFGEGLIKFFSGDFQEGIDKMGDSFKGMGQEIADSAKEAGELADVFAELERREIGLLEIQQKRLAESERLKNIRDQERNSIQERIRANERLGEVERARIQTALELERDRLEAMERELELIPEQNRTNQDLRRVEEQRAKIQDLIEDSLSRQNEQINNSWQLQKEVLEAETRISKAQIERQLMDVEEGTRKEFELRKELIENKRDLELEFVADTGRKAKAIRQETQNELLALNREYYGRLAQIKEVQGAGLFTEQDAQKAKEEMSEAQRELLEMNKKFHDLVLDRAEKANQQDLQNEKKTTEQKIGIWTERVQAARGILDSYFQHGFQQRQKELQDLQQKEEAKLRAVGDNEEARTAIKRKFDRKEAQIKREQARADKREATFNAVINTAVAITRALGNPILMAIIAAAGAAQVATIQSRPVPQFFKGTKNSPEGPAWLGERGKELVEEPSGRTYLTNDGPQLGYLKKGSTVYTHEETKRILQKDRHIYENQGVNHDSVAAFQRAHEEKMQRQIRYQVEQNSDRIIKGFENALNNRPENVQQWSERGLRTWIKKRGSYIERLNKENSL